jgi:hypothetical protein
MRISDPTNYERRHFLWRAVRRNPGISKGAILAADRKHRLPHLSDFLARGFVREENGRLYPKAAHALPPFRP